jgi:hypothetical protein
MRAAAKPLARLLRALEHGELTQAESAVISETPEPTLAGISSLSLALADLLGVSADVSGSRLALSLRQLGLQDAARVAERFT